MTEELDLITGLDQPIPYDPTPALKEVTEFYERARGQKSIEVILSKAKELIVRFNSSGISLAKLLYMLKSDWDYYEVEDNFEDTVFAIIGLHRTSIDRYLAVWTMFAERSISEKLKTKLEQLPMKSLIPISKTFEQGYYLSEEKLKELANAPDDATVRQILRNVKGTEPRKSGLMIVLKKSGDLVAKGTKFIGWLALDDAEKDIDIAHAIERIIASAGIVRE